MPTPDLWPRVLADLEISLTTPVFKTWFARTICLEADDQHLLIGCPNGVAITQITAKYQPQVIAAVERAAGQPLAITYTVHQQKADPSTQAPLGFDQLPQTEDLSSSSPSASQVPATASAYTRLNPNYTLDQFVVGSSNRVAHAAALAIIDNPGKNYNPFFIYGGTGVGKTHLVQAIGNALQAKYPKTQTLYCSIERFMNDFIDSLRFKNTNQFKNKYRSCDVLIVDDIQFIAGDKAATQEEFFHTFNELHASGRQIILCSDRPPREIATLADRLTSRFEGGLTVDIAPPDFETRAAIIQAKASLLNIPLTPEITEYLSNQSAENIRAIEGMMLKLQTVALANPQPLTLTQVQALFGPTSPTAPKPATPNLLLKQICEKYSISLKELLGKKRTQNLVAPRHLAMYILRQDLDLNLETIGQILGGRDHTTIMHGIDKVSKSLQDDTQLQLSLQQIRHTLH